MVAIDGRQRTVRHPSQVCATKGSNIDPEASDQQRHSRTSAPAGSNIRTAEPSVNRDDTNTVPTATTLRQSGTQSSRGNIIGNLTNRKKKPKDLGTDPFGRPGTIRPPTTSTDESTKQNGADVYGSDRLLSGRYDLLRTDECSNNRETLQLDRANTDGSEDAEYQYELYDDEDASHQPSDGHRTDAAPGRWSLDAPDETRFPPNEESTAYVACASVSDGQPAVLHECLAVTAVNPVSKKSCRAVIMFDSGTTYSHVSAKLARLLDLPHGEMRVQNVSTFGSETPLFIRGFRTFLVLCSEHGRSLQLNVTVLDHIVSSVRTALVRDADLPSLRRDDCIPNSTREMPDLLIGQDLVHLFDHEHEPTLPSGYYIVRTSLGPAVGGARRSVTQPLKARASFGTPAAHSAAEDVVVAQDSPRRTLEPPPSQMELTSRHHHPPSELPACPSANSAADIAVAVPGTNECLETSTPTLYSSGQPSHLSRASGSLPRSTQKQLFQNPPDTKPLFLPTYSFVHVDVEEVSPANSAAELLRREVEESRSANSAAGLPRPIQKPFSSIDSEHRCSTPPLPTHGDLIRASPCDAGSQLPRKTRLRYRLPADTRQLLGIYSAPEPAFAVTLSLSSDSTFVNVLRAGLISLLVLMPSTRLPPWKIAVPFTTLVRCPHLPRADFVTKACAADLLLSSRHPPEVIYAQPHLLIGMDEMLRLQYRHGTRVALGGNLQADTAPSTSPSTSSRTCSFLFTDSDEETAERPSRLREFSKDDWNDVLRRYFGPQTVPQFAYLSANSAQDTATHEDLEPLTSTSFSSGQMPPCLRRNRHHLTAHEERPCSKPLATNTMPRSTQKELFSTPLDTQPPLLLPATSTTYVEVEKVSSANSATEPLRHTVKEARSANSAAEFPRPLQDEFSFMEDEICYSSTPPPPRGNSIRTSSSDAESPPESKTRLRYRLPDYARQILGVYTAHEPVLELPTLRSADPSPISLPRAEPILHSTTSHSSPSPAGSTAAGQRRFARAGTRRENACDLRPPDGLQTHARGTHDRRPLDSAHQQPARNAHSLRNGQLPTPQSATSWPTDPPPARQLTPPLPPIGRVRLDPHPKLPADIIPHNKSRPLSVPAALPFSSFISQRFMNTPRPQAVPSSSRTTSSILATNISCTMATAKRRSREHSDPANEVVHNDSLYVVTDACGHHRTALQAQVERMVIGNKFAATTAPQANLTTDDRDAPIAVRQGVPASANSAALVASTTNRRAVSTEPTDSGDRFLTSSASGRPTDPREHKHPKAIPSAATDDLKGEGVASLKLSSTTDHAKLHLHQDASRRTDAAFLQEPARSRNNWHDAYRKNEDDADENKQPARPPQQSANSAAAADVTSSGPANSAASAAGSVGKAAQVPSTRQPTISRASSTTDAAEEDATVLDATRSSLPPRGPRADLVDQGLHDPRRRLDYADADPVEQEVPAPLRYLADAAAAPHSLSSAHYQAARATQEPLEPLVVASSLQCVFCGRLHLSYDCDVYTSVAQRLQRARKLGLCFSCLGQDHLSRSCPISAGSVCKICRHGLHHEAFCHSAAPRVPTTRSAAFLGATETPPTAATPTDERISCKATSAPSPTTRRRTCAFCQSFHGSRKCTVYASVNQRLTRARQLKMCFVCLRDGHHSTSCPASAKPCSLCSNGSHHQALCRRRITKQSTYSRADGTRQVKKRVNTASVRVNNRNDCPPKNGTICFCDAPTFHQFGRQLRPGVLMIKTPMSTPADATNFVRSFRPTREAKRVIFWFSSCSASLNHVELIRLITELSHYYTTRYQPIMQYVVVSPSVNSRRDLWTCGIFKYLVQAQVLLPDARLTLLPHGHHDADAEVLPPYAIEDVKYYLREHCQLDLWTHYHADHQHRTDPTTGDVIPPSHVLVRRTADIESIEPGIAQVSANSAAPEASSTLAATAKQNPCVQDYEAATDAAALLMSPATPDAATSALTDALAIAAPAASLTIPRHHCNRGHSDRRSRRRDQGPAPQVHGLDYRTELPPQSPNKDRERNQ